MPNDHAPNPKPQRLSLHLLRLSSLRAFGILKDPLYCPSQIPSNVPTPPPPVVHTRPPCNYLSGSKFWVPRLVFQRLSVRSRPMNAAGTAGIKWMKVYVHRVPHVPPKQVYVGLFSNGFFFGVSRPMNAQAFLAFLLGYMGFRRCIFSSSDVPRPFLPFGKLGLMISTHFSRTKLFLNKTRSPTLRIGSSPTTYSTKVSIARIAATHFFPCRFLLLWPKLPAFRRSGAGHAP